MFNNILRKYVAYGRGQLYVGCAWSSYSYVVCSPANPTLSLARSSWSGLGGMGVVSSSCSSGSIGSMPPALASGTGVVVVVVVVVVVRVNGEPSVLQKVERFHRCISARVSMLSWCSRVWSIWEACLRRTTQNALGKCSGFVGALRHCRFRVNSQ
jgi:hypothetical protein